MSWEATFHGGAFDGAEATLRRDPPESLILWRCDPGCDGHLSDDLRNPRVVVAYSEVYRREEIDMEAHVARYDVGTGSGGPLVERERELVA